MVSTKYVTRAADEAIARCIDGQAGFKSYFLLAGAGSGKTGALVYAAERYLHTHDRELRELGKRIGIITYTNAAADEIARRIGFNPVVVVATIHSFCWALISGYNQDIRAWMKIHLEQSVVELEQQQAMMLAFLKVEGENRGIWSLGLYGDTMQKIYGDGVANLKDLIPAHWEKPSVAINHRSGRRIIELINSIRRTTDDYQQTGIVDRGVGHVRIFLIARSTASKSDSEARVATLMGQACGDAAWSNGTRDYKVLILEHRMAAKRMGFNNLYSALAGYDSFKTGLATGDIAGITLFVGSMLPLLTAHRARNAFETARIVRESCPLLSRRALAKGANGLTALNAVRTAVTSIMSMWDGGRDPTCGAVLRAVRSTGLFEIPDDLQPLADLSDDQLLGIISEEKVLSESESRRLSWCKFLQVNFIEVERYANYLTGDGLFGTHQGVKGLEYPRVMVVIDDEESGGFLFSYDKLFGLVNPSERDLANDRDGKDSSIARTRRLFYVTCSRARDSLAVVCYVTDPVAAKAVISQAAWFSGEEIIVV